MKTSRVRLKGALSIALSLLIAFAFSLSSLAASGSSDEATDVNEPLPALQAPTGNLTVRGDVLLNGNTASTGATVLSGSLLQTRTNGHATVDMGSVGRVDMDPITAITLSMSANAVDASLDKCGQGVTFTLPAGVSGRLKIINASDVGLFSKRVEIDVRVFRGEAVVKYGQNQEKTLDSDDHEEFDNAIEVTSAGDTVFKVYCLEDHPVYLFFLSAIAIPIIIDATGEPTPVTSPIQP